MKKIICTILLLIFGLFGFFAKAENIKYDYDDIEVRYAAEFTANPQTEYFQANNWIVSIAGGIGKPIQVVYGIVDLKKNGETQLSEEFIKVSGEGGSERFLINSASYEYYSEGNYKNILSLFWSAKKLIDNTVVKDFTPPIKSIVLAREFDESQNLKTIALSFSREFTKEYATANFHSEVLTDNIYLSDPQTFNQRGVPTSIVSPSENQIRNQADISNPSNSINVPAPEISN